MTRHPKLLALTAGLISAIGFAPLNLWPVTLFAGWLIISLTRDAPNLRGALARGYWFGFGNFVIGLNWIAGAFRFQETMPTWLGYVAVVALAFYLAVYPAMAAGVAWRGRRQPVAFVLFFAFAWVLTEYLRATMFTGFAWNPIGMIWLTTPVAGFARWIGTYGLSGLVMLVAGLAMLVWHDRRRLWPYGAGTLVALPLVGWLITVSDPGTTTRQIRVVQANIGQAVKQDPAYDARNFQALTRLTGPPGATPRLILWPEAAVPYFLEEERWARERIAKLMGPNDVIMTGGDALVYNDKGDVTAASNSLFAMTADAKLIARYDKSHLVPYGEYLPMRPILSAIGLSRLVPGDLDFLPGPGPLSYPLPGFGKIGVQICYEIIFSGQVVDSAHRPDFLFNPSNDAWFGAWGPPQHLAQARMRALEEGMPIVRATPTGISAVIDANGRIVTALPMGKAGFIKTTIPAVISPTPFARYGNILSIAFAFFLGLTGVAIGWRRR
ncbi:apolipoprotein N-acyltransferase [Sphingomonas sp.]|uniref:apolipoprotein N-acyltransferase n=1 Tax=Sphingomonas sp. TaxID=28214 RepID=UPI0025F51438|nr:apolipoprotein N-acyltransferase [Sphingomonas sp.]